MHTNDKSILVVNPSKVDTSSKVYTSSKVDTSSKVYTSSKVDTSSKVYTSSKVDTSSKVYTSSKVDISYGNFEVRTIYKINSVMTFIFIFGIITAYGLFFRYCYYLDWHFHVQYYLS